MAQKKHIEVVELTVGELTDKIGNPRKITTKKKKELSKSLKDFGDFGVVVIDEDNNIISGHQRVDVIKAEKGEGAKVLCKRLVGYSESEKRAINIKANTHAGEWDLDKLAAWTADLTVNLGINPKPLDAINAPIKDMELIRYEKYDYVLIVCRKEYDYNNLVQALGIEDKKTLVYQNGEKKRKIKCRAVWFDDMKAKIVKK